MIVRLRDLLRAVGQLKLDRDVEAFGQPLDAALAGKVGEFRRPVQDIAQLFEGQFLTLQRADHPKRVLGRAHVQFHGREIDVGLVQHRLGPLDHGRGHVDHDEVEIRPRHVQHAVDVFRIHDVERQHL